MSMYISYTKQELHSRAAHPSCDHRYWLIRRVHLFNIGVLALECLQMLVWAVAAGFCWTHIQIWWVELTSVVVLLQHMYLSIRLNSGVSTCARFAATWWWVDLWIQIAYSIVRVSILTYVQHRFVVWIEESIACVLVVAYLFVLPSPSSQWFIASTSGVCLHEYSAYRISLCVLGRFGVCTVCGGVLFVEIIDLLLAHASFT
jgi:hypothetical protein